ncbi:hypothetical protein FOB58_004530 [Candida parapsilosis]|uniref:Uncharacterized protein n=2 Tax=Candida parapsilosis TaxID=5480 RepID=G8B947_CANPC|nr:uncharacterized protein CPAR2_301350 [Candida parapsilosis]KAF6046093.1 hypothetical protein FOB58_004530 [Candida parapsilosis]KAF6046357.1 hypothetical protein FOB59_003822 [Candida parapsilosis]KAF6051202.1 hypothetical protein FOB60_003870 [Candida parapsilosis]KAF6062075.1 hypothetical protein FOB61_003505 [Candida parapsilosis]CCE41146.1 hypothetical protein CPAR2_301350 [Candida parapsilosis]
MIDISKPVTTSDALIYYADHILDEIDNLAKVEYNKKGRKYRFVNNAFQRIRQEDKHLVICPEQLDLKLSFYSAFSILINIGDILNTHPQFCCTILGLAQELEKNHWYEEENSSIIHFRNAKHDPRVVQHEADAFVKQFPITQQHIDWGINLMVCSKLNFLHTDHHIGTKLEGVYMRQYVEQYFGEEALTSLDVLVALKSCVHWGNIKGILYKLKVPNIDISPQLMENFANFPDPDQELCSSVYDRFPSGTSKYHLLYKSLDMLGLDFKYSHLITIDPKEFQFEWLYNLCHDIEFDPIKYHLRAKTKQLCSNPVNLSELAMKHNSRMNKLFDLIALIINIFQNTGGDYLLQNSKIPKLDQKLIDRYSKLYQRFVDLAKQIEAYEMKNWTQDDIIARLQQDDTSSVNKSLHSIVSQLK